MPTILETPRLILREIELDDDVFIHELMNEPAWLEFIGDRQIHGPAQAREFIRDRLRPSYSEHGFGFYLVELRENATPLGICGLIKRDSLEDVDLGFAILERHRRQGYAREAAEAIVEFSRSTLGLRRLAAVTKPSNRFSIRLIGRLGMSYEGMVRLDDQPDPICLYTRTL